MNQRISTARPLGTYQRFSRQICCVVNFYEQKSQSIANAIEYPPCQSNGKGSCNGNTDIKRVAKATDLKQKITVE